jgi:hypothetical protein
MSRYDAWLKTCPLWQYVLAQTTLSGVGFGAVFVIFHEVNPGDGLGIAGFYIAGLACMAFVWARRGKRRNGTA